MKALEGSIAQWFGDHLWALWLSGSLLLASAEMLTLDLTLLMLAGGALAGALTALIFPGLWLVQVLVAVVVSVLMLFVLRPVLLNKVRDAPGYRSSLNQLLGSEGIATAQVTATSGEVKVRGETWTARSVLPGVQVDAGETVEVQEIDGTTLLVYPVNRSLPWPPTESH